MVEEFKKYNEHEALQLKRLIEKVLNDHENFEIVDDYDEIRALDNSSIPKLKALRFKMLLNKIQKERYRVDSILSRLNEIEDEERFAGVVQSLTREGLISEEQFENLMKKDAALELNSIVDIIKEGEGNSPHRDVADPVEEGEGLQEDVIYRRRNRLLDLVRKYQSEADLLRDIDWTKTVHVF